jgi:FkbH-like protein
MKLSEALCILNAADPLTAEFSVALVTGNTPQPLSLFLAAYIQQRLGGRRVKVETGLFGDFPGNLAKALKSGNRPTVILMEWADLDPRLGLRQTGGWGRKVVDDILHTIDTRLEQIACLLEAPENSSAKHAVLVPPTLAIPPVIAVPERLMNALEIGLEERLSRFLARIYRTGSARIVSLRRLSLHAGERIDVKSWWSAGSPYQIGFASGLAALVADTIVPPPPAKGLITDLDNTLWLGILGDVGVEGICWDLDHHAVLHGVYQQFLQSLADDGVLLAIASKNDREQVDRALARTDLLLNPRSVFPVEVHWQPKFGSVNRILRTWNIGADRVIFLDDNPVEVASVQAEFPAMDCRVFPADNPDAFVDLLADLADRFGKSELQEEDRLRSASIRSGAERATLIDSASNQEDVLKACEGELLMVRLNFPPEARALELVNKTNQFNLNGQRFTETDWLHYLKAPGNRTWIASYKDKFGPLGKISVIGGRYAQKALDVDLWVLSCRAFSRRIEYAILEFLFEQEDLDEVTLHFRPTERNTPTLEFLTSVCGPISGPNGEALRISRAMFEARKPIRYLKVSNS